MSPNDGAHPPLEPVGGEVDGYRVLYQDGVCHYEKIEEVVAPKEAAIVTGVDLGDGPSGRVLITAKAIETTQPKRDAFAAFFARNPGAANVDLAAHGLVPGQDPPPLPDYALTHALRGAAVSQHGGLTVVDYRQVTTPPPGELLPCPFCGGTEGHFGTDSLDMEWETASGGSDRPSKDVAMGAAVARGGVVLFWWVACDCGARGPSVEASPDGAREAWNRRAAAATEPAKPSPTYPVHFYPSREGGKETSLPNEAQLLLEAQTVGAGWIQDAEGRNFYVQAQYSVVPW